MKWLLNAMVGFTILSILSGCGNTKDQKQKEWRQLFNGKDMSGWQVKISGYPLGENFAQTFRVEDGILKASYSEYEKFNGEFGHLFFKEKFSDYKLRIEYRITGEQCPGAPGWAFKNSGVMLHAQSPESMGLDQDFPISVEAQFLGGDGQNRRPTPSCHRRPTTSATTGRSCCAGTARSTSTCARRQVALVGANP